MFTWNLHSHHGDLVGAYGEHYDLIWYALCAMRHPNLVREEVKEVGNMCL